MDSTKTRTEATIIDRAALDKFLRDAKGVNDADTLAEMLADLAAEHAGKITAAPDGSRVVNTMDPVRLLDAIRQELRAIAAQADREAAAWTQSHPNAARWIWTPAPIVDRLEDAGNLAGMNAYRLALKKPSIKAVGARKAAGTGKPLLCIETGLNEAELTRLFNDLANAGYIDGTRPAALQEWLNIFNPAADTQGRAVWIKTAKSGSLNKSALLDLLDLLGVKDPQRLSDYPAAFFGVEVASYTRAKNTSSNHSCEYENLQALFNS